MEFKNIRHRLNLWFFLVAMIPLITVIAVIYVTRVESIKVEAFDKLIVIRDLKVVQLKHWIKERRGDIYLLASEPVIKRLGNGLGAEEYNRQDFPGYKTEVREALNARLRSYKEYSELLFVSAKTAKVIVSSRKASEGQDQSENTAFTTPLLTRNIFIKDIHYNEEMNVVTLTFSAPVFSSARSDEITAVVMARIDLHQSLYALLLDRSGMGNTGETLIVNKEVIALNELRWHENAPLNLKINAKPAVYASHGRSGIIESADYRGRIVLAAYTYIPDPGWGFVAKQYQSEIYKPIQRLLKSCFIITVVSALMVYLASLLVSRSITRPIVSLVGVAKQLQGGDLSARSSIVRVDEVGSLSAAFDNMAVTLDLRSQILTSIAEIMTTMVEGEDIEHCVEFSLQKLMTLSSSEIASFYMLEPDTGSFVPVVSFGFHKDLLEPLGSINAEEGALNIESGGINHIKNISVDMFRGFRMLNGEVVPKEIITVPWTTKGTIYGVFYLGTTACYSPEQIEIVNKLLPSLSTGLSSLLANDMTHHLALDLQEVNVELECNKKELQQKSAALEKQNIDLVEQKRQVVKRSEELKLRIDESELLNKAMVNLLEDLQSYQNQLEATSKKLAYSNKELEGFSYSVSHDLRAPLRHMSGFVNLLQKHAGDKFDDKSNHYVKIINDSAAKMGQLIDDLLYYSRTGRAEMHKKMVNTGDLVQEVVREVASYEKGRQIEWIIDQLPQIYGDSALLRVVWINLLSNAIKFTGNLEKARIEIGSRPGEKDEIVYYVKDNGAGFDMKYKDKIFGVFQRLHRDSEFKGTGIGLATVQSILYRHGGRIWAEGTVGEGAVFFFALPKEI